MFAGGEVMPKKEKYQWETTSDEGFVRYLVANILPHGYRFYTCGTVKPKTCLEHFDEVMQEKYNFKMSRSARCRRKAAVSASGKKLGLANVIYLRRERFYILIATPGNHPFFRHNITLRENKKGEIIERRKHYRDAHRDPIFFDGYSIRIDCDGGYKPARLWADGSEPEFEGKPKVRVRIATDVEKTIREDLLARARSAKWPAKVLENEIRKIPYLRYGPVRQQLKSLVLAMNRERAKRGFVDRLDATKCISSYIPPVGPYDLVEDLESAA